jgi:hypothetical protein
MEAHNAGLHHPTRSSRDKFYDTDTFERVAFTRSPTFDDVLSNSHQCPNGGVTNWEQKPEFGPLGYPGWKTHIQGTLVRNKKHDSQYPYGDALNLVGIRTGSGGGGNASWSYECYIFLDDWPGLQATYLGILMDRYEAEMDTVYNKLKGIR